MSTVDYINEFVKYFTMLINALKEFFAMISGNKEENKEES